MSRLITPKSDIASMGMDAAEMLGSILKAIRDDAQGKWGNGGTYNPLAFDNIRFLARTGADIADDFHNVLACLREDAEGEERDKDGSLIVWHQLCYICCGN